MGRPSVRLQSVREGKGEGVRNMMIMTNISQGIDHCSGHIPLTLTCFLRITGPGKEGRGYIRESLSALSESDVAPVPLLEWCAGRGMLELDCPWAVGRRHIDERPGGLDRLEVEPLCNGFLREKKKPIKTGIDFFVLKFWHLFLVE
jgi:hypothetical protein